MLEVLVNSENTMLKVLVNEKVIIQEGKTGDMQLSNVRMPILYNPSLVWINFELLFKISILQN